MVKQLEFEKKINYNILVTVLNAPVAQWIECWPPEPKVVGSTPAGRTKFIYQKLFIRNGILIIEYQ